MNYISEESIIKGKIKLTNYLPHIGIDKVREEIFEGLNSNPKQISSKFFYDQKGSELFYDITKLEEYYPTRTETKILTNVVDELDFDFRNISIVELGSGDASKIRLLLQQIPDNVLETTTYIPVDISQSAIEGSSKVLEKEFPMISINGIVADFIHQLHLIPKTSKRLFCFFGSTIGNLETDDIIEFMKILGKEMQTGDSLLLGMDMVKDIETLESAYNDKLGVTAEFNKNILNVVNHLINSDFDTNDFEHFAYFNKIKNRIEMHLKASKDIIITYNSGAENIYIKKDETIHTENSHKFSEESVKALGNWAGLETHKICSDEKQWFSLVHYTKTE
jgi:L-histidine N-alpha-methyltransferase